MLEQNAVFEAARFVLSGIADDVAWRDGGLSCNRPFFSDGIARSAATSKAGVGNFLENGGRRGIPLQGFISA